MIDVRVWLSVHKPMGGPQLCALVAQRVCAHDSFRGHLHPGGKGAPGHAHGGTLYIVIGRVVMVGHFGAGCVLRVPCPHLAAVNHACRFGVLHCFDGTRPHTTAVLFV